jgi:molybdate transport system regulatory protein
MAAMLGLMPDFWYLTGAANPEETNAAQSDEQEQTEQSLHPGAKLWLCMEKGFFGPGAFQLLILTEKTNSIKDSCKQMGMSYSKAWKLIYGIEAQLGCKVLTRIQGGAGGGGAYLTAEGKELVRKYELFRAEAMVSINDIFKKHFGDAQQQ